MESEAHADLTQSDVAELIINNRETGQKMARSILAKWGARLPKDDVDSIVDVALCEAARRFSPDKGASFTTFLFHHIRGRLTDSISNSSKAVKAVRSIQYAYADNIEDMKKLDIDDAQAVNCGGEDVPDESFSTPEEKMLRDEIILLMQNACHELDERQREVIQRMYLDQEPLREITKSLGMSKSQLFAVKRQAFAQLKNKLSGHYGIVVPPEEQEGEAKKASRKGRRRHRMDISKLLRRKG